MFTYIKQTTKMEHYGDIHLHHGDYPQGCPKKCGENNHYEHGNMCGNKQKAGVMYRNGHAYDCGCNLCSPTFSVPYADGPGGFLGDMLQFKPCHNPYCVCTDCSGDCKCNAKKMAEKFADMNDVNMMHLFLLIGGAALIYYFYFYKK